MKGRGSLHTQCHSGTCFIRSGCYGARRQCIQCVDSYLGRVLIKAVSFRQVPGRLVQYDRVKYGLDGASLKVKKRFNFIVLNCYAIGLH